MPDIYDHILLAIIAVVLPIWGFLSDTPTNRDRWRAEPEARLKTYRKVMLVQWLLVGIVIALWLWRERSLADLGLSIALHWQLIVGCIIMLAIIIFLFVQQRIAISAHEERDKIKALLDRMAPFLPRSARELWPHFAMLCLTAGVCEEILYRGWLFWYLGSYIGETTLAMTGIVILAAIIFGLAHAYQGKRGIIQVLVLALIFGGLYVFMGTLWPLMVFHAAIDLNGGMLASKVLDERVEDHERGQDDDRGEDHERGEDHDRAGERAAPDVETSDEPRT